MIEIANLTKTFGSFTAVDAINLKIEEGELFGFLGPNGAGKTTTIKMMTGLYAPNGGSISLAGIDTVQSPLEAKRIFGYIPDQPFLYDKLTGREFLYFSGGLYDIPKTDLTSRIDSLLEELHIGSWVDRRTEEYSQGMRQRITIAAAFLHNPKVIIIDEPMVGLDPQSAHVIKQALLEKTATGVTVFMSTHSLNVVEEICTRVGIIRKGNIIFDDTLEELVHMKAARDNTLEQLFIELTND